MSAVVIITQLFPPPTRSNAVDDKGFLATPFRQWLFSVQALFPLVTIDTTNGDYVTTLPPAGLNSATGQSNQNSEITYLKSSADVNTGTIHGAQSGSEVLLAQFEFRRFKSDGTHWWLIS